MGRASLRFDEKLFDLKMAELLPQVYGLAVDDTPLREALTIQEGSEEAPRGAYGVQLIDRYFVRLREQLQGIDRIARVVWQIQGEAVTPEFVRKILFPKAMGAIDAWLKTYTHTSVARDTEDPYPAQFRQVAVLEVPKLRRQVNARYEIEARTLAAAEPFTHSEDYRSVTVRGEKYTLTPRQAQMIKVLHEAHKKGTPHVSIDYILENLETENSRWQDTWRKNGKARGALIQAGERKGTVRLNL